MWYISGPPLDTPNKRSPPSQLQLPPDMYVDEDVEKVPETSRLLLGTRSH
jgi:hypothetical protein